MKTCIYFCIQQLEMIEQQEKEHMKEKEHIVKKTHKGEIEMDEDLSTLEVSHRSYRGQGHTRER